MENYSVQAILSARDAGFTAGMKAAQDKARNLENRLKGGLGFGIAAGAGMKAFSVITGAIGGMGSAVDKGIKRADTLRNFTPIMKNLGYGAKDSKQAIDMMVKSIDGLPTALDDIASSTTKIAPLAGSLKDATKITVAMNNALLAGGKSAEQQKNGLEQFAQMLSAGKVDMQSWRSMLDAMPAQLNQIAKKILGAGKNQNDLREAMKSGKVTFKDFNNALLELNEKGLPGLGSFQQQAKVATQGIGTSFTNVRTAVVKNVANMIQRTDNILKKNGFGTIAENLNKVKDKINRGFKTITESPVFEKFIKTIASGIKVIASNAGLITKVTTAVLGMKGAFKSFGKIKNGIGIAKTTLDGYKTFAKNILNVSTAQRNLASIRGVGKDAIVAENLLAAGYEKTGKAISIMQSGLDVLSSKLKLANPLTLSAIAPVAALTAGLVACGVAIYKNVTANQKYSKEVDAVNAKSTKKVEAVKKEGEIADFYANQLDNLAGKENKSAADKERMSFLTEQLNSHVKGLGLAYDKETDSLNMSTAAIHKKIEAIKLEAMAEANKKGLAASLEEELKLQNDLADAKKKQQDWQKKLDEYKGPKTHQDAHYQEILKNYNDAKEKVEGITEAQNKAKANTTLWEARVAQSSGNIKTALSTLKDFASKQGFEIPQKVIKGIQSGNIQIPTTLEDWNTLIQAYGGKAANEAGEKGKEAGEKFGNGVASQKDGVKKSGQSAAQNFISGLFTKFGLAYGTGQKIAGKAKSGAGSVNPKSTGINFGILFNGGISSNNNESTTKGKNLGKNAKDGLKEGSSGSRGLGESFGEGFLGGLGKYGDSISEKAKGLGRAAFEKLKSFLHINSPSKIVRELGYSFGEGFEVGINAYQGIVGKAGVNLAKAADLGITKEAEIHSPSKKAKKRGKHIGRGLSIGIAKSAKLVQKASKSLLKGAIFKKMKGATKGNILKYSFEKTATASAKSFESTLKSRVSKAIKGVNAVVKKKTKTLTKSKKMSKSLKKAYSKLGSAFKSKFTSQVKKQMDKSISAVNSKLSALGKKYQERYNSILQSRSNFVDKMRSYGQLFSQDTYGFSKITDFNALNRQNNELFEQLKKLQSILGTSDSTKNFIDQITQLDPSQQIIFLNELLKKSKREIQEYYRSFNNYWSNAGSIGTSIYQPFIKNLDTQYNKELKSVISNLNREFNNIGRQATNGMMSGLKNKKKQKALKRAAASLANLIKKEVKKQLKIHSPSRVMDKLGQYTGQGFANGIQAMGNDVMKAMNKLTETPNLSQLAFSGGFSGNLSSDYDYSRSIEQTIIVPVNLDGKPIAKATAPYIIEETDKIQRRENRKNGRW